MNPDMERYRLEESGRGPVPMNAGLEVSVESADSRALLDQCREVLLVVVQHDEDDWPELSGWRQELPEWFVLACGRERTQQEAQEWLTWWRSLPAAEQAAATEAKRWSLSDWLWWLEPDQRTSYWLGADVLDAQHLLIYLETEGSPAPIGALRWLLKAAGATRSKRFDDRAMNLRRSGPKSL